MATVTRSASIVTVTCVSTAEMENKLSSLRQQLSKLPPLPSGKKRSFARQGLILSIPEPVWNELAALQTRQEVTAQLVSEIAGPINPPEPQPSPSLSWSREQLQLACLERGLRYKAKMNKAQLLALLA